MHTLLTIGIERMLVLYISKADILESGEMISLYVRKIKRSYNIRCRRTYY